MRVLFSAAAARAAARRSFCTAAQLRFTSSRPSPPNGQHQNHLHPGATEAMKSARSGKHARQRRKGKDDAPVSGLEPDAAEVDDDLAEDLPALHAVVKVFTTHSDPDFCLPWQKQPQQRSNGTGFVIAGRPGTKERFVLTNAHCVEYHTQVQLKRRGDDAKFTATVLAIGWECDLALLAVDDPAFFEGHIRPVPFTKKLPHLEDPVMCAGYPVGGETLSVTSGVVSRIEVTEYTQCKTDLLGIQIDAAINAGNSGGPALNARGECVGVAFQSLDASEAESIGYIIPIPVVEHFLRDVAEHGKYRGFPSLGLGVQNMENKTLRAACKMKERERGVLVRSVLKTGCCHDRVKPGDVLLSFEGQAIGYDGTVPLRQHERVAFTWIIAQKHVGDEAEVKLLRDGERIAEKVTLTIPHHIVPYHLPTGVQRPSYFIVGGVVFTTLSQGYMKDEYGEDWKKDAPLSLAFRSCYTRAVHHTEELVVIAQILAHDLTVGYEGLEHGVIDKVQGQKIESLFDLVCKVKQTDSEYLRFDLRDDAGVLIIPVKAALEALPGLMEEHCVKSEISDDLAQKLQELHSGGGGTSPSHAAAAAETPSS